jgi:hypothetical protein
MKKSPSMPSSQQHSSRSRLGLQVHHRSHAGARAAAMTSYQVQLASGATQPADLAALRHMWAQRLIHAATPVWRQGLTAWSPMCEIPELSELSQSPVGGATVAAVGGEAGAAAATAAGGGGGAQQQQQQYTVENGFTMHTNDKGEKFVWDDARQEWLPHEQAMYMLGFDGAVAEAPPAANAADIESKLQATRPLDELGEEMAAAAEAAERQKQKQKKREGGKQGRAGGGGGAAGARGPATAGAGAPQGPPFSASASFTGSREGCSFKLGELGLGYYLDPLRGGGDGVEGKRKGVELTEEERLRRNKKKTEWRKQKRAAMWTEAKINTNVYVKGLPPGITEAKLVAFFSKVGMIRTDELTEKPKIKIYRAAGVGDDDGGDGAVDGAVQSGATAKGDALVSYLKEESVQLALEILDSQEIEPGHRVSVERATFRQKGTA